MEAKQSEGQSRRMWLAASALGLAGTLFGAMRSAQGQAAGDAANGAEASTAAPGANAHEVAKINAWTVGFAAGELEGAPIRFATDIARVVDDGDKLHVLPIVTRGPTSNVEALLYLKGVDVAIINADSLEQFRSRIPDIQQRIDYLLSLFPSEMHVFVRPEIKSLEDLRGKKVNFNTEGTAAAYTGPVILDALRLNVQKTFIPHQIALQQLRHGQNEMQAVVFITSKPVPAFVNQSWPPGFKLLPVPFNDFRLYLPASLSTSDYPQLIPSNQQIQTVAVPTILAAYNWPIGSDRYNRVARLVDYLFSRLDTLQGPGFHPKWKDVVLNASIPALRRFPAAQRWLDSAVASASPRGGAATSDVAQGSIVLTPQDARLYQEFLHWRQRASR